MISGRIRSIASRFPDFGSFLDIAIATALAVAVWVLHPLSYVFHHPLSLDEAWVATLARAPAGRAYALSSSTPVGWLFLVRLVPGGRGEQLRVVPLVFAAGEVAAAYVVGRCLPWRSKMFRRIAGTAVSLIVLLAPISLVRNDLKQYTADAFFALVILALTSRAEGAPGGRTMIDLAVTCVIAMFFSTVAAFVAIAAFAGLLCASVAARSRERIRTVIVGGAAVSAVGAVYFASVVVPHTNALLRTYWNDYYLPSSPWSALSKAWHRFAMLAPALGLPAILAVALFVAGCVVIHRLGRPALAYALVLLWIEMAAVGMAHRYPFLDLRTSHFLLVVSLVPIAVGFLGIVHELPPRWRLLVTAVAIVASAGYLHSAVPYVRARWLPHEDVRSATAYVAHERGPGDIVVITLPSTYGFSYYWPESHIHYLEDAAVSTGFVTRVRGLRDVVYVGSTATGDTTRAMQTALRETRPGSRIFIIRSHLLIEEAQSWERTFRVLHLHPASKHIGDEPIWIVSQPGPS